MVTGRPPPSKKMVERWQKAALFILVSYVTSRPAGQVRGHFIIRDPSKVCLIAVASSRVFYLMVYSLYLRVLLVYLRTSLRSSLEDVLDSELH